jgi:hypothetical protein
MQGFHLRGANHQPDIVAGVPVLGKQGDLLEKAQRHMLTGQVQVLQVNGTGIGCFAKQEDTRIGVLQKREDRVIPQVGVEGDGAAFEVLKGRSRVRFSGGRYVTAFAVKDLPEYLPARQPQHLSVPASLPVQKLQRRRCWVCMRRDVYRRFDQPQAEVPCGAGSRLCQVVRARIRSYA